MEAPQATRPTVVTVLGVLFIIGAAFGVLASFMFVIMGALLQAAPLPMPAGGELPPSAMRMFSLFRYAWIVGLYSLLLAGIQLAAAIALLRLRAWGRTALEIIVWWNAVLGVGYVTWTAATLAQNGSWVAAHSGAGRGAPPAAALMISSVITTAVSLVLGLAVNGTFLYFLRSRTVREAMRP